MVVTNTTPIAAYRGAGRPEATAAIERAVDLFAAEIGMDPAEVRRHEPHPGGQVPVPDHACGAVYDSGDYTDALDKVLAARGLPGAARRAGRADGSAVTCSSSASGCPATWRSPRADADGGRDRPARWCTTTARPRSTPAAPRTARGTTPRGPCWSQAELGIPMEKVTVRPRRHRPDPDGHRHLRRRGRCSSAAWPCTRPRSRSRSRPGSSPRTCSRPARPTSSSTPGPAPGRSAATRRPARLGRGGQPRRRRRPDRRRSTSPRPSPRSRSAPTSRWWRSTPRPARRGCSGT